MIHNRWRFRETFVKTKPEPNNQQKYLFSLTQNLSAPNQLNYSTGVISIKKEYYL